jgi:hypothetical protein
MNLNRNPLRSRDSAAREHNPLRSRASAAREHKGSGPSGLSAPAAPERERGGQRGESCAGQPKSP